ncbi:hypothetical protein MKL09_12175 [Methylobacterium sp. J-048]|uniref:hypothetical protein n=1 Tax=Methylobacterium sp. J-048 TaxID=2836635 RepID=UPI001FBA8916|nr:hypothetical protein [Methylobacterium sp. J-048]MCJ2057311.1 hypothetical protein [Methylobacterium sp. J-048]
MMSKACAFCGLHLYRDCQSEEAATECKADRIQRARDATPIGEVAKLGLIKFHSQDDMRDRFYHVVNDLRAAGCIVDLWLMDLATVMGEHGYEMTIRRTR